MTILEGLFFETSKYLPPFEAEPDIGMGGKVTSSLTSEVFLDLFFYFTPIYDL